MKQTYLNVREDNGGCSKDTSVRACVCAGVYRCLGDAGGDDDSDGGSGGGGGGGGDVTLTHSTSPRRAHLRQGG